MHAELVQAGPKTKIGCLVVTSLTKLALDLKVMNGVRSTTENLQDAITGENFEFKEMYPNYVAAAMEEGAQKAMLSFNNAMEVEKVHHRLYIQALDKVEAGEDLPVERIYVCSTCGNTVMGQPPEKCPVCGVPKEKFNEVK